MMNSYKMSELLYYSLPLELLTFSHRGRNHKLQFRGVKPKAYPSLFSLLSFHLLFHPLPSPSHCLSISSCILPFLFLLSFLYTLLGILPLNPAKGSGLPQWGPGQTFGSIMER